MEKDVQSTDAAFSLSLMGAVVLTAVYVLQTQFQAEFFLNPGTTLIIAFLAALGAALFRYSEVQEDM